MHRRFTLTRTLRTLLSAAVVAVCFLPVQAQDPAAARVLEMTGQVSVMDGGYRKALNQGDIIAPQHMIVTGPDGFARFQVISDGSTFEVYANSHVMFRENRGNWMQLLNVFLGRVKVFITHKPGGNANEVSSPTAVISVRGTVFDVSVQDDEGTTVVSVDEGLVMVRNLTAPGDSVAVHPGESLTVIKGQPLVARQIDKSGVVQAALRVARDTMWQILLGRRQGGGPVGSAGSSQGDRKGGGTSGTGGTTSGPGAPTSGPGAPASAPGAPSTAPGGGH